MVNCGTERIHWLNWADNLVVNCIRKHLFASVSVDEHLVLLVFELIPATVRVAVYSSNDRLIILQVIA